MPLIRDVLRQIEIAPPLQHDNLVLFPLLAISWGKAGYLTLDEAMDASQCAVCEVSEGGVVAELRFENRSPQPILLLDGEELAGAKQNRVLNLTILCGGELQINIPVSCVEQGRWRYRTKHFQSAKRTLYGSARAAKMRSVSDAMRETGARRSDQQEVWRNIAFKQARMAAESSTGASEAIYEKAQSTSRSFVEALGPVANQVGAVFAINGQVVAVELFDAAATYAKVAAKLIESFALDAVDVAVQDRAPVSRSAVAAFFDRLGAVSPRQVKAVGLGNDLRLESDELVGAALEVESRLVHFSAFALPASGSMPGPSV